MDNAQGMERRERRRFGHAHRGSGESGQSRSGGGGAFVTRLLTSFDAGLSAGWLEALLASLKSRRPDEADPRRSPELEVDRDSSLEVGSFEPKLEAKLEEVRQDDDHGSRVRPGSEGGGDASEEGDAGVEHHCLRALAQLAASGDEASDFGLVLQNS